MSNLKLARSTQFAKQQAQAALTNEQITRQRVDQVEAWAKKFSDTTFLRRLRWLFLGR